MVTLEEAIACKQYDYIIAGGGLSGCVLASRLSSHNFKILLLEAGPNQDTNPQVMSPLACPTLHGTDLEWNYKTTPQRNLNGRQINIYGGRILSGSSAVNYGVWTRCSAQDWDLWAQKVDDRGWGYEQMLPFFRMTENSELLRRPDGSVAVAEQRHQHGFDGPIYTQAGAVEYPLREVVRDMWTHAGVVENMDANGGDPLGMAFHTENWHFGKRQPAGLAYGLHGVDVVTDVLVHKLIIDESTKSAKGVEVSGGRKIFASKEVILCCGAMRSPQLLMLSGIGPADHLQQMGIPIIHDDAEIGGNFHDHSAIVQYWKLKDPEKGYALGHPVLNEDKYTRGFPIEWLVTASSPEEEWENLVCKEGSPPLSVDKPRAQIETLVGYVALPSGTEFQVPFDGTHISTASLCLLPTSRGRLSLATTNVEDMPLIDPNYCDTEADMFVMREAMRLAMRAVESTPGQSIIAGESIDEGWEFLTSKSSDEELDRRIRACTSTWWHPAGTLSMGKVVDTSCRFKGISNLRIVDASILPVPLSGHYQAPMYAIAERAASLILQSA